MYQVTNAQVNRLVEMRRKNYRVTGVRFHPFEGHLTVSVSISHRGKPATRYFYIGQKGQLLT